MATSNGNSKKEELEASKVAVREALDKLMEAKQHFQLAAESAGLDMKSDTVEQFAQGKEKAEQLGQQLSDYASDNPMKALAFAFAGGFLLAQLLKK
jgi:ElaB/YqjD/DUF883 family membrane-anchored ribosome-binding protein